MKRTKVYIIVSDWAYDDDFGDELIGVFVNKDDARAEFAAMVEKEKTQSWSSDLTEEDIINDYFIEDREDYYEIYKNDNYNVRHTLLRLVEMELR